MTMERFTPTETKRRPRTAASADIGERVVDLLLMRTRDYFPHPLRFDTNTLERHNAERVRGICSRGDNIGSSKLELLYRESLSSAANFGLEQQHSYYQLKYLYPKSEDEESTDSDLEEEIVDSVPEGRTSADSDPEAEKSPNSDTEEMELKKVLNRLYKGTASPAESLSVLQTSGIDSLEIARMTHYAHTKEQADLYERTVLGIVQSAISAEKGNIYKTPVPGPTKIKSLDVHPYKRDDTDVITYIDFHSDPEDENPMPVRVGGIIVSVKSDIGEVSGVRVRHRKKFFIDLDKLDTHTHADLLNILENVSTNEENLYTTDKDKKVYKDDHIYSYFNNNSDLIDMINAICRGPDSKAELLTSIYYGVTKKS